MTNMIDPCQRGHANSEDMSERTFALIREVKQLRAMTTRLEADRTRLEARIARLEEEQRKYLDDYLEVEQQNSSLASLFVASHRLHSTLSRADVLTGIEEIIVNLVGSEELAVIEVDDVSGRPRLSASFGIAAGTYADLPEAARERIAACMESREIWVRNGSPNDHTLTACIPLAVEGVVRGAIVIFRLLQQKVDVEAVDRELFGVLATHAAAALYCTSLHAARLQPGM